MTNEIAKNISILKYEEIDDGGGSVQNPGIQKIQFYEEVFSRVKQYAGFPVEVLTDWDTDANIWADIKASYDLEDPQTGDTISVTVFVPGVGYESMTVTDAGAATVVGDIFSGGGPAVGTYGYLMSINTVLSP